MYLKFCHVLSVTVRGKSKLSWSLACTHLPLAPLVEGYLWDINSPLLLGNWVGKELPSFGTRKVEGCIGDAGKSQELLATKVLKSGGLRGCHVGPSASMAASSLWSG